MTNGGGPTHNEEKKVQRKEPKGQPGKPAGQVKRPATGK